MVVLSVNQELYACSFTDSGSNMLLRTSSVCTKFEDDVFIFAPEEMPTTNRDADGQTDIPIFIHNLIYIYTYSIHIYIYVYILHTCCMYMFIYTIHTYIGFLNDPREKNHLKLFGLVEDCVWKRSPFDQNDSASDVCKKIRKAYGDILST